MELKTFAMNIPDGANLILGQAHFIKTVEDLFEIMITAVPDVKFGVAFSEASGPCLIRTEGNDEELIKVAAQNAQALAAGHTFNIVMKNAYPVNMLNAVKQCQEVCTIFCATANPVEVIVAKSDKGCGVLGVIDGFAPKGVESAQDKDSRSQLLRNIIGYKK
jgi:uncharacterized protein